MRHALLTTLCLLAISITTARAQQPGGIYVNGTSGSDIRTGLSWGAAVRTINKGIQRAQEYNLHEIWVTQGTYIECVEIVGYYVHLYGGFVGGEVDRSERDWVNNVTTIQGKCDDNLQQYCPAVTITNASNTRVDGFTITGGGGTMPPGLRYGGGFHITLSNDVWLWNDIITSNTAIHGGGIYALQSGLWIKDCSINSNTGLQEGGGIFMDDSDFTPYIEHTTVDNNMSFGRGGNILMDNGSGGWIIYDEITNGVASHGGGIACYHNSSPYIHQNNISGNFAGKGGGMYLDGSSPETLLNRITGNGCGDPDGGGGIHCANSSSPRIERNRIKSNYGEYCRGGGIYVSASSPMVINNIIDYNTVKTAGGGMAVENGSSVTLTNNTFAWNEAFEVIGEPPYQTYGGRGGALYITVSSTVTSRNNIFYQDLAYTGVEVYCCTGCTYDTDYNCYYNTRSGPIGYVLHCEDNTPDPYCPYGEHDIWADPKFLDADYHLAWDSPVIDKGDNNATGIPGSDYVDGDPRKMDGDKNGSVIVDIGADEYWPAIESLAEGKGAADGAPILLEGMIATAVWPDYLYVQHINRTMGIRVEKASHGMIGRHAVRVYGHMKTSADLERYIQATSLTDLGVVDPLEPLGVTNRALGGNRFPRTGANYQIGVYSWNNGPKEPPWAQAPGLNNIGLLVKVWGKITWVNRDPAHPENEYIYIDDGSMRFDGTMHQPVPNAYQPNVGVRVVLDGELLQPIFRAGCYIGVTGISSCRKFDSDPVRLVRARSRDMMTIYHLP